jgi:dihydroneopterin aldolase
MYTISLQKVKSFAKIGLYPQEWILGNHFETDIAVQVASFSEKEFVDYTVLNNLIQQSFAQNLHTLEALALAIHTAAKLQFPFVQNIKVTVRKLNPPMPGEIAAAEVSYQN